MAGMFNFGKGDKPSPFDFAPRKKKDRNFLYNLYDNIAGIDDGVNTPGERLGKGVNDLAKGLASDPAGMASKAVQGIKGDLDNLMFEGGAMERPQDVLGYAAAPMAPGVMSGRVANVMSAGGAKPGIKAYHGSPHSFDKFSMDAIGTGEGAQAYGHGLYFAENEGVAKGYRDALAGSRIVDGRGVPINGREYEITNEIEQKALKQGASPQEAADIATGWGGYVFNGGEAHPLVKDVVDNMGLRRTDRGSMYEVNIDANPDDFLDWDAPLSAQPKLAQRLGLSTRTSDEIDADAMRLMQEGNAKAGRAGGWMDDPDLSARIDELNDEINRVTPDVTGEGIYRSGGQGGVADLMSQLGGGSPQSRSDELSQSGIKGIKYRDAGSRGLDGVEGTRNFVVFDENLINIVKKYGVAGAATMLGVGASDVQAAIDQGQQQ